MIIGKGLLAKAFKIYENINNILIFASGISNSQEQTDEPFEREKNLLEKTLAENQTKKFIYFSTCSIEDPSMSHSRYVKHKLNMENLIQTLHPDFYIFRLSQVIGKTNSPTIIHYFYNKIIAKESFEIWNKSTRNLIDVDDIVRIVQKIINESLMKNKIINIASPVSVDVPYIVRTMENILKIEAQYASYDKGVPYSIDISPIKPIMEDLAIKFDDHYLEKTIRKYYDNHEISI